MQRLIRLVALTGVTAAALSSCGSAANEHVSSVKTMDMTANQCPRDSAGAYVTERPIEVDEPHADAGLAELTKLSTLTVAGKVSKVEDGISHDSTGNAAAAVTVRVSETLRGHAGDELTFRMMSPCIHGIHFAVPGQPVPRVGDSGVWFLMPDFNPDDDVLIPISSGSEILFDATGRVINHGEAASLRQAVELGTRDEVLNVVRTAPGN